MYGKIRISINQSEIAIDIFFPTFFFKFEIETQTRDANQHVKETAQETQEMLFSQSTQLKFNAAQPYDIIVLHYTTLHDSIR